MKTFKQIFYESEGSKLTDEEWLNKPPGWYDVNGNLRDLDYLGTRSRVKIYNDTRGGINVYFYNKYGNQHRLDGPAHILRNRNNEIEKFYQIRENRDGPPKTILAIDNPKIYWNHPLVVAYKEGGQEVIDMLDI